MPEYTGVKTLGRVGYGIFSKTGKVGNICFILLVQEALCCVPKCGLGKWSSLQAAFLASRLWPRIAFSRQLPTSGKLISGNGFNYNSNSDCICNCNFSSHRSPAWCWPTCSCIYCKPCECYIFYYYWRGK